MVVRKLIVAATVLTIAAGQPPSKPSSSPSQIAPPPTTMNCLLASNLFMQRETDPKLRNLAAQTLYFYLGRIDPRVTPQQLKVGLRQAGEALHGANAVPLMNSCSHELQAKAQTLQSVAGELQQAK